MRLPALAGLSCALAVFSGCAVSPAPKSLATAGAALHGRVHGGQQPIVGAHIYLLAANSAGYGKPSLSLLSTSTSDSLGSYVLTDTHGDFDITGDYTCTPGTPIYTYANGGDAGLGTNAAIGLLAIVGLCPTSGDFSSSVSFIFMNEVSTVAAAYSIAGFAIDATHVASSGTPLAQSGIANAFLNAPNLADLDSGHARMLTLPGNGVVPQAQINTLANVLSTCINSSSSASPNGCTTLFALTLSSGSTGSAPSDTASAAINIAHYPGAYPAALFALQPALVAPYSPSLTNAPNDFLLRLKLTGGGLNQPFSVAIDAAGNAWFTNFVGNAVSELAPSGRPLSPTGGFTGGGLSLPFAVSIDPFGNAWIANGGSTVVTEISPTGTFLSGAGFAGDGTLLQAETIAIDGAGNAWIGDNEYDHATELSSSGQTLSPQYGFKGNGLPRMTSTAIDPQGNAWFAGINSIAVLSPSGSFLSGTSGYTNGVSSTQGIAFDSSGDAWIANFKPSGIAKLAPDGALLSPPGGYTGGGLAANGVGGQGIAIDGGSNIWATNLANNDLTELAPDGSALSPDSGFLAATLNQPGGVAVDGSGNVWIAEAGFGGAATELIGAAAPLATPLSAAVKNGLVGQRP